MKRAGAGQAEELRLPPSDDDIGSAVGLGGVVAVGDFQRGRIQTGRQRGVRETMRPGLLCRGGGGPMFRGQQQAIGVGDLEAGVERVRALDGIGCHVGNDDVEIDLILGCKDIAVDVSGNGNRDARKLEDRDVIEPDGSLDVLLVNFKLAEIRLAGLGFGGAELLGLQEAQLEDQRSGGRRRAGRRRAGNVDIKDAPSVIPLFVAGRFVGLRMQLGAGEKLVPCSPANQAVISAAGMFEPCGFDKRQHVIIGIGMDRDAALSAGGEAIGDRAAGGFKFERSGGGSGDGGQSAAGIRVGSPCPRPWTKTWGHFQSCSRAVSSKSKVRSMREPGERGGGLPALWEHRQQREGVRVSKASERMRGDRGAHRSVYPDRGTWAYQEQ